MNGLRYTQQSRMLFSFDVLLYYLSWTPKF